MLSLLTAGITASGGAHSGAIPIGDINSGGSGVLDDFLNNRTYDNTKPKAFLNWIIVDEEFKKVTSSFHMGAVQVPQISGSMQKQSLTGPANMTVRRNGWLYVYLSNESNMDVYFDDLIINQKRGSVVEANNYYAFGMEIPVLNSKLDVEQFIIFGGITFPPNPGANQQTLIDYRAKVPEIHNSDGTVSNQMRLNIQNSSRFKKQK